MADQPGGPPGGAVQIMTTYRVPERHEIAACAMCGRERKIVFDLTAGGGGRFEVMSVCDECAPRAEKLMAWLRRETS